MITLEELTTLEKLNNCAYECEKSSPWKESTQRYMNNLLVNNIRLQNELRTKTYRVSRPNHFTISERGKLREIDAPVFRDRVVQKDLCKEVLIPQLTRPLIYDNYASLKNRGTSFARKRIEVMLRKYINKYGENGYILQIDIRKYFDSIDHEILKAMLHERLMDISDDIRELIDYLVDSSSETDKGLNLGSEAPQIFAIYYLSGIDSYIKTVRSVKYYGRYMDDMFIISDDKEYLKRLLTDISYELSKLKLTVNEKKTRIAKLTHGFTLLQTKYHVTGTRIVKRPAHKKVSRERRKLRAYKRLYDKGKIRESQVSNCYKSWRNTVLKDCNACRKTIDSIDRLYSELFPIHVSYLKRTREKKIHEAFKKP